MGGREKGLLGRGPIAPPGPKAGRRRLGLGASRPRPGSPAGDRGEGRLDHSLQGARGQAVPALPLNAGGPPWQFSQGIPARVSGFGTLQKCQAGVRVPGASALPTQPPSLHPLTSVPLPGPTPQPAWWPGLEGQVGIIRRPWLGRRRLRWR